jgi:hypothetical protein
MTSVNTPAECPSPTAQAYDLLLVCRLHYETPGETEEFVGLLAKLLPGGEALPMALPAVQPDETTSGNEIECMYRRALAVWSHPDVAPDARVRAHGFLMRYLARGRAAARFVAAVSDEAMLTMARMAPSSGESEPNF